MIVRNVSILVLMDLAFEYISLLNCCRVKGVSILVLMDLAFELRSFKPEQPD